MFAFCFRADNLDLTANFLASRENFFIHLHLHIIIAVLLFVFYFTNGKQLVSNK